MVTAIDANAICRDQECERTHCTSCLGIDSEGRREFGRHPHDGYIACTSCAMDLGRQVEEMALLVVELDAQALDGTSASGRMLAADSGNPGGEPLLLLAPHADPETRERRLDLATGDVEDYLDRDADTTPLELLDRWALIIARQQGTNPNKVHVEDHIWWAAEHLVEFGVLLGDVRRMNERLKRLVCAHADRRPTPVPCRECSATLVRTFGYSEALDGYECTRQGCGAWHSDAEVAAGATWYLHSDPAPETWLVIAQAADVLGVPQYTVRTWAQRDRVAVRVAHGSIQVWWPDVVEANRQRVERLEARQEKAATA